MSRLGKKPLSIPSGTEVKVDSGEVKVKGPLGEVSRSFGHEIGIEVKKGQNFNEVILSLQTTNSHAKAMWGTVASHIKNMIEGVNQAFTRKLIIEGIGFKAEVKGKDIILNLGFSHPVKIPIPEGLKVISEKGLITISGINKESVSGFAANVRRLKEPEPYKGKGIRYDDEIVKRKQGKKTA